MIGKKIRKIRKSKKLTQAQLAKDICTQAHISLIEQGKIVPGLDVLNAISIKLETPVSFFLDSVNLENGLVVKTINQYMKDHRYSKVNYIVREQLKFPIVDKNYKCFLEYAYIFSKFFLSEYNKSTETIHDLKKLLKTYQVICNKNIFLRNRIYNAIGIVYASEKKFSEALLNFNKILYNTELEDYNYLYIATFKLRILFNKIKLYYELGDYDKSFKSVEDGITLSLQMENMSFIGNFYYYLAKNKIKLGYDDYEIKHAIKKSYFFFELLNKEYHLSLLKDEFGEYLFY